MSPIQVTIHRTGTGDCLLSGKSGVDGVTVTFEDGTVKQAHLSWKSFKQLLALKCSEPGVKADAKLAPMAPVPSTAIAPK